MDYMSTRDTSIAYSSAQAMRQGLSSEGGLFIPKNIVRFAPDELYGLRDKTYKDVAFSVMSKYLTDFSEDELRDCIDSSYNETRFSKKEITPLVHLYDSAYILELFHGPTCAFKDVALQILPKLLTYSIKKTGEDKTVMILVATSGDTGKAALEGFKDVDGTRIMVFYPNEGVSEIQKLQMITQEGKNVCVVAVEGNFDTAQNGVKRIFTDTEFNKDIGEREVTLSSANSINWGRLLPQIVYYVYSYARLLSQGQITKDDKINICVPTGNFGNILAAYYAMLMGVPVNRLICASNKNNVLSDFIKTGIYDRNRSFHTTISPSMDILISSNLERLLFSMSEGSAKEVTGYMDALSKTGRYEVSDVIKKRISDLFAGSYLDDDATKASIKRTWEKTGYLCDTHTGVAIGVYNDYVAKTNDKTPTIIASTASPYKFAGSVLLALDINTDGLDDFALLDKLSAVSGVAIPSALTALKDKKPRFMDVVLGDEMGAFIKKELEG